ncbi:MULTISPECIES: antitoxin [Enterococcus]|uniref:antitoxin n=1 Tax=Enterococcus TaxID=1350 RepID=UPI000F503432|nr:MULTISPECIES: antitoxin [Enterococcus]MEB4785569.1 antitoxin [Enterococcus sp. E4-150]ROY16683.1 antitoxin [Enterococcus faecium]HAR1751258.1 antitoxin [Enterococcus faecium]
MTTEEVIQMRIRSIQREIDDLKRTKAVMVNETSRKAINLHIENLRFVELRRRKNETKRRILR